MKINQAGLDLIKKYEGFRSLAYRDAVGIWTIGYGHTSMAGPPKVTPKMSITQQRAERILARDVERFSRQIRPLIQVPLNDNQFSALVSFAYNVGIAGFRKSSVLRRVNDRRFEAVPARLSLWIKAGGKTLNGLVRRRSAEGELFLAETSPKKPGSGQPVKPVSGKPVHKSTTNLAAILSAISGLISAFMSGAGNQVGGYFVAIAALVIIAATLWIFRERWIKSRTEGV